MKKLVQIASNFYKIGSQGALNCLSEESEEIAGVPSNPGRENIFLADDPNVIWVLWVLSQMYVCIKPNYQFELSTCLVLSYTLT